MTTQKIKVAIYIRVSTREQAEEGYSIGAQEEKLRMYCAAKGWTVSKVYSDAGFSGAKLERPMIQQLINDVKNHKIQMVLVYKLDRLSRSQKDTLYLIEDVFLKNDCEFASITENFDTSTSMGRAMIGVLSVFSQLERERIAERMAMGAEARAQDGYFHGGGFIPIGYDYVDGELVINEYEAMQVRMIVDMFINQKLPLSRIWKIMNESGYKYKYGDWSNHSSVRSVLNTPLYYGKITWNKKLYDGRHTPIYDEETWNRIQARFEEVDKNKPDAQKTPFKHTSLLGGMVFCGNCGARYFTKQNVSKRPDITPANKYYTCYSRGKTSSKMIVDPHCKNPSINVKKLDQIIIDEIKKLALDENYLEEILSEREEETDTSVMSKRITEIDKQINKLMDLYQIGGIDFTSINTKIEGLIKEKDLLQEQIKKAVSSVKKPTASEIKKTLKNFEDIFTNHDFETQRLFVNSLISKIVIYNDTIKIHWSFL